MADSLIETPLVLEIRTMVKEFERTYLQNVVGKEPTKSIRRSYIHDGDLVVSSKAVYSSEATASVQLMIDLVDQFLTVNRDLVWAAQKVLGRTFLYLDPQSRKNLTDELRFIVKAHKYVNDTSVISGVDWLKNPAPELPRSIKAKLRGVSAFTPAIDMLHTPQSDGESWAKTMSEISAVPISCLEYSVFIEKIHTFGLSAAPKMSLRTMSDAYNSMTKFLLTHGRRGYSEMGIASFVARSVLSPGADLVFEDTPEMKDFKCKILQTREWKLLRLSEEETLDSDVESKIPDVVVREFCRVTTFRDHVVLSHVLRPGLRQWGDMSSRSFLRLYAVFIALRHKMTVPSSLRITNR